MVHAMSVYGAKSGGGPMAGLSARDAGKRRGGQLILPCRFP
jgi:hypothetical protein